MKVTQNNKNKTPLIDNKKEDELQKQINLNIDQTNGLTTVTQKNDLVSKNPKIIYMTYSYLTFDDLLKFYSAIKGKDIQKDIINKLGTFLIQLSLVDIKSENKEMVLRIMENLVNSLKCFDQEFSILPIVEHLLVHFALCTNFFNLDIDKVIDIMPGLNGVNDANGYFKKRFNEIISNYLVTSEDLSTTRTIKSVTGQQLLIKLPKNKTDNSMIGVYYLLAQSFETSIARVRLIHAGKIIPVDSSFEDYLKASEKSNFSHCVLRLQLLNDESKGIGIKFKEQLKSIFNIDFTNFEVNDFDSISNMGTFTNFV